MSNHPVLVRLQLVACSSLLGAALGFVGATIVWEFIYAIGDRVVSDAPGLRALGPATVGQALSASCTIASLTLSYKTPAVEARRHAVTLQDGRDSLRYLADQAPPTGVADRRGGPDGGRYVHGGE